MPPSPTPTRDPQEESADDPAEPERRSHWPSTLVNVLRAGAAFLASAAAVITALSGWDRF